jgi:hypothetical protein
VSDGHTAQQLTETLAAVVVDSDPRTVSPRPASTSSGRIDEMISALRTIPYGGIDDSTKNFELPPAVRATVGPLVNSLRWGALTFGIVFAAPRAFDGDLQVVITLTVCIFITCWRTALPIKLASTRRMDRAVAFSDTAILGAAIGVSDGLSSPFVYCLLAAILVVAFGWGTVNGMVAIVVGMAATWIGLASSGHSLSITSQQDLGTLAAIVFTAVLASLGRARLLDAEQRRESLVGRVGVLSETNDLLTLLNSMARSLPTSLNVREAVDGVRNQITSTFDAPIIAMLEYVPGPEEWVPKLAENCVIRPSMITSELPEALHAALASSTPVVATSLRPGEGVSELARSGVYSRPRRNRRNSGDRASGPRTIR